ncbi:MULTISPECIES: hypothetical protein [unclassified Ruegeria]|uniref:hypothetical protein n=1 Tax=unclassified Ruegeria TaxID=2625375 RepID=UPI001489209F|nr:MULTISPECIES: hypothetical protein [unclassified Ruegeria]
MFRCFISTVIVLWPIATKADVFPPALSSDYSHMIATGPTTKIGLVRNGNYADNTLGGTRLVDSFRGAGGNDVLIGYDSVDTYTFELGDGADIVVDHSVNGNRIKFIDVPEGAVRRFETLGRNGETDLLITYGDNDAIRVVGWSELSENTKSGWAFDHVFRPKQEPVKGTPSSLVLILTDPMSALKLFLLLFLSFFPLARVLWVRRQKSKE